MKNKNLKHDYEMIVKNKNVIFALMGIVLFCFGKVLIHH